jgi:hypothetical protein
MRCSLTPQFWAAAGGGALTAKRPATTARGLKKPANLGMRIGRLLMKRGRMSSGVDRRRSETIPLRPVYFSQIGYP